MAAGRCRVPETGAVEMAGEADAARGGAFYTDWDCDASLIDCTCMPLRLEPFCR